MKLLGDRVLLKPDKAKEVTTAGVIIPDAYQDKQLPYKKGTVVKVGTGKKDEPIPFEIGDRVLYHKEAGSEIKYNDDDLLLIRYADIYATIGEEHVQS